MKNKLVKYVLMDAEQDPDLDSFGKYCSVNIINGVYKLEWDNDLVTRSIYRFDTKQAARQCIIDNHLINKFGCLIKIVGFNISVEQIVP